MTEAKTVTVEARRISEIESRYAVPKLGYSTMQVMEDVAYLLLQLKAAERRLEQVEDAIGEQELKQSYTAESMSLPDRIHYLLDRKA